MSTDSKFLGRLDAGLDQASVPNGAALIIAFSGGPDSSALLAGMEELGKRRRFKLLAVHVNHQIRPEHSDRDQLAAQNIAESLNVEFTAHRVNVLAIAAANKDSIESAARQSRYEVLSEVARKTGAYGVVTGHTRNDQAETVLLHAIRGAGLKGISGMKFASVLRIPDSDIELNVLRPMLDTPRTDCIEYCEQLGITPVIDSSNISREYTRNQLRLDV
ncbi:MAG: tRNA lysidine(34) synthetase TilS, partial [Dehalococcoidia bacterium]